VSSRERASVAALTPARIERVTPPQWRAACERQAQAGGRFCGLFASDGAQGLQVNCIFTRARQDHVICTPVPSGAIDTLIDLFAAAGWDEREAHELGATGVPFFVLDRRYGVSGGQPAEVFRQALEEAWRTRPQAPKLASVPGLASDEIAQSGEVCGPDGTCTVPQR